MVVGETHHFSLHRLETLGGGEGARDAFQRTTFQLWKSLPTFEGRDVFFHMSYMKMVGNTFFPIHRNNCSQFFSEKMVILSLVMAVYKRLGEMFVGCVLAIYAMSLCFLHVQYGEFQQCEKPKEIDNTKLKGALVLAIDLFRG